MSKLINEDWEHAAYANDKMYEIERRQRIEIEWQEWDHLQSTKNKKPAKIIVNKPPLDEDPHNPKDVSRTHQKKL
jgi:hypothetical protein